MYAGHLPVAFACRESIHVGMYTYYELDSYIHIGISIASIASTHYRDEKCTFYVTSIYLLIYFKGV